MLAGAAPAVARPAVGRCLGPEIASLPLLPAGDLSVVPVLLNGRDRPLIVDTGATHLGLSERAVRSLGLAQTDIRGVVSAGIGGVLTSELVDLRELNLDGVRIRGINVPVIGLPMPTVYGQPAAGVLGTSVLSRFDVDLDFPGRRMTLFLRPSCDDVIPPWTGAWSRLRLATEPSNLEALVHHGDVETAATGLTVYRGVPYPNRARLFTVVRVNGVPLIAIVDSGASVSTLAPQAAARAGLPERGASLSLTGVDEHPVGGRMVRAARVDIGADSRADVSLGVADLDIGDADMLLGHDLMADRRVLISFGARTMFWQAPPPVNRPGTATQAAAETAALAFRPEHGSLR